MWSKISLMGSIWSKYVIFGENGQNLGAKMTSYVEIWGKLWNNFVPSKSHSFFGLYDLILKILEIKYGHFWIILGVSPYLTTNISKSVNFRNSDIHNRLKPCPRAVWPFQCLIYLFYFSKYFNLKMTWFSTILVVLATLRSIISISGQN